MVHGRSESIFGTEDISMKHEPGTSFAIGSMGYIVLEDGSVVEIKEASYRKLLKMLDGNKIYTKDILNSIPEEQPSLLIDEDVDIDFYSVHDIVLDIVYDENDKLKKLVKKRLSFTTLGEDVIFNDAWRVNTDGSSNPKVSLNTIFSDIMSASFSLDEYFDKDSNKKLLMDNEYKVDTIVLRLRKMDNPVSETDSDKFMNVLLTGKGALDILSKLKADMIRLNVFSKVYVENTYNDGSIDSNFISFKTKGDSLRFIFDEYNNDLTVDVDADRNIITIKHRFFGEIETINTIEPNSIFMTKSIIMNSNGHITSMSRTDLEITKEINSLYYTRNQIDNKYIGDAIDPDDSSEIQKFTGSLSVNDLLVRGDVEFKDGYEVSKDSSIVVVNSTNTAVDDPIITIGTSNTNGDAESVGTIFNVYRALESWDDNILTGAIFTSEGAVYGLTGDNMSVVVSKDIQNYKPEYYESDGSLNSMYYVSDAYLELKPAKINMLLALAPKSRVNYDEDVKYFSRIRMYVNNILNADISDIEVHCILQYKTSSSLEYHDFSKHVFEYQDTGLQDVTIFNTYDIDKIRLRIFIKVKKSAVDKLNKNDIIFSLQQLGIFGYNKSNVKLDATTTPMYADRYYSEDTLSKASYIYISNGNQPQSFKNLTDISLASTIVNIDSSRKTLFNGKECHSTLIESLIGESNIVSTDSKMKLFHIRGLFTPNSATYETSAETQRRSTLGVLPDIRNYKFLLKIYTCMYSDLIISLGSSENKIDDFGKKITVETQTTTKELVLENSTLLMSKVLDLENMSAYGVIDELIEIDMTSLIHKTQNTIEYFTGKFRNDSIHFGFSIEIIKDPISDKYNEYGDMMTISKFSAKLYDVLREYRGTSRDVVVDMQSYNDIPVMFLDTSWQAQNNVLSTSTILNSNGVSNVLYGDDSLTLRVNKTGGADYSVYNWTDTVDQYDNKTYMTAFRFKKGINNLMKVELKLDDILFDRVRIDSILNAKCYAVLFIFNSDGSYTNIVPYKNSRLNGDVGTTHKLIPERIESVSMKSIAELRRMAKFITHQTADKYETFKLNDDIKLYYDLNNLKDDIILELDIFIDIPVNNKQIISSLDVVFSKMSVKMISNISYKMRLVQELSSMQSMIFDKKRNKIRFIDNKFEDDNTASNINHLSDIDVNVLRGLIDNIQGLENDLSVKFLKDIEGEFTISDVNNSIKRISTTMKTTSSSDYGLVGLLSDFDRDMEMNQFSDGTTYSAQAIYRITSFLHKLLNNKEVGIENASQERIATARAIFNLYTYYKFTVAKVSEAWAAESTARRIKNTIIKDLLHFEQWDMVSAIGGLRVAGNNSLWLRAILEFNNITNTYDEYLVLEKLDGSERLGKFSPSLLRISAPQAIVGVFSKFELRDISMPSGVVISYSCNAVPGYNLSGLVNISYSQYSAKMNRQKAADPYFMMLGLEKRDGNYLYSNNKAMIGGSAYYPPYANNNNHGLHHISRNVLFDSVDEGSLKALYIPEFTTSDYIEYIYCMSPRLEAHSSSFSGEQDYVNQTCGDDFSMNYQSEHYPGVSARGFLYGGALAGGGGYYNINFVPPYYTQFRFVIQVSADNGSSWSDLVSFTGRFFSLEAYLNKSVKENYVDCAVEKRYRVILDILHQPLDIDSYGPPMSVGRMGELNGGFAESRFSHLDDIPHRVPSKYGKYEYGKNFFRRLKIKYIKHYLEPWEQPQEYLMTGDTVSASFYGYNSYNYSYEDESYSLANGKSDVPIVLYKDATSYMKRNHALLTAQNGLKYYNFKAGSYWLSDGFSIIPVGVTKIIPIPEQSIRDALYSHADYCSFMISLELRRGSIHPRDEQEAATTGTVIRSWNYVMTRTRNLDINKSIIPDTDDMMNIDPNYRYWYYIKWGKNGIWVDGINLAGQTGIVRRSNKWDSKTVFGFYGIIMKHKYYIYR